MRDHWRARLVCPLLFMALMKNHDADKQLAPLTPAEITELDAKALATATGGYRTDGVDSVDYQTWYFGKGGPGAS